MCDGTVVLFGGWTSSGLENDTWMFNGASWTQVSVSTRPPARLQAAMATLGNQVVLFGGYAAPGPPVELLNDTWTFDGSSWTEVPVPSPPPARQGATMATLGNEVVLFGGASTGGGALLSDTWTFDGTNWTQMPVSNPPPARWQAAMATLGNEVVLFGGVLGFPYTSTSPQNDTWTFDGTSWTQRTFLSEPPSRSAAAIGTQANELLLVGGLSADGSGTVLSDAWTFDGPGWSHILPSSSPPARWAASMATLGSKVVLFGGTTGGFVVNDTWTFDGMIWFPVAVSNSPPARYGAAMATLP